MLCNFCRGGENLDFFFWGGLPPDVPRINTGRFARPMLHSPRIRYIAPPHFPKHLPIHVGDLDSLSHTWFHEPIRPTTPNGISIASAVFPEYKFVTNGQTDQLKKRRLNSTSKNRPFMIYSDAAEYLTSVFKS